jgi:hypothetical protein
MALNQPSMFDTQYAMDRQMQTDAMAAGQLPLGGGMMYASSLGGDMYNEQLMGLAGMLGGSPDPRIGKQQAIDEIQQRFPNPDTYEEFMELGNAFRLGGFYDFAEQAIKFANDIPKADYSMSKADSEGFVRSMTTHLTTTDMLDNYNSIRFNADEIKKNDWTKSNLDAISSKEITTSLEDFVFSLSLPPYNLNKMAVSDMLSSGNWMIAYKGWVKVHGTKNIKIFAEQFIKTGLPKKILTADGDGDETITDGGKFQSQIISELEKQISDLESKPSKTLGERIQTGAKKKELIEQRDEEKRRLPERRDELIVNLNSIQNTDTSELSKTEIDRLIQIVESLIEDNRADLGYLLTQGVIPDRAGAFTLATYPSPEEIAIRVIRSLQAAKKNKEDTDVTSLFGN